MSRTIRLSTSLIVIAMALYGCGGSDTKVTPPPEKPITSPVVVGAISTGNTNLRVTFSKAMSDTAIEPGNYSVVQENVNGETGFLTVTDAEFSNSTRSSVLLTTLSQNEVTYRVGAIGVTDRGGRNIDVEAVNGLGFSSANSATFAGTPPSGLEINDSDNDGLADNDEQRGWLVTIVDAEGHSQTREVSSDPFNPDTDGDGLSDKTEHGIASDPRREDSDADGLLDDLEFNAIFSSPTKQDSDGDGLADGFEFNSTQSSPILADTDGDQLDDNEELFVRFRNPRIADLPNLDILPGRQAITLNESYTYTDATGEEITDETSSTAVLGAVLESRVLKTDQEVVETIRAVTGNFGLQGGLSDQETLGEGKFPLPFIRISAEVGFNREDNTITSSGSDEETVRSTQRVLEESYARSSSYTSSSEVVREITSAAFNLSLTLKNSGDIAFSVSDIEVSVFRLDQGSSSLEPLTTLTPSQGASSVYYLGPFDGSVGPLIFTNEDFPAGLAEELMANPSGLAFRIANYTILDEFGRQFTYINQEVKDKTAGLVIDYGFVDVERYQIAASGIQDTETGATYGLFNDKGLSEGIPLTFLLENQLGMPRNPTGVDSIIAGADGVAASVAVGDDVQRVAVGTRGLPIGEVVVDGGPDGILDSAIETGDEPAIARGFDTSVTCGTGSILEEKSRKTCSVDSECTATPESETAVCDGPSIITRVGGYKNLPGGYSWVALTDADLVASSDIDSIVMKPGDSFKLAFVQDLDRDGIFAREEFMVGSTDSPLNQEDNIQFGDTYRRQRSGTFTCPAVVLPEFCGEEADQVPAFALADSRDTDRDGIDDPVELQIGWEVAPNGQARKKVFPSPVLRDSDGDGLTDWQERDIRFSCDNQFITAGTNREVEGTSYNGPFLLGELAFSNYTIVSYPGNYNNQRLVYTDSFVGASTNLPAGTLSGDDTESKPLFLDDSSEINVIAPFCQEDLPDPESTTGGVISRAASLDPLNPDTDGDGVSDGMELLGYTAGAAMVASTDYSAVSEDDAVLFSARGDDVLFRQFSSTIRSDDVILLPGNNGVFDSDYPSDYPQLLAKREGSFIRSNPLKLDTDDDLLSDGTELLLGTNPIIAGDVDGLRDSDGDGVFDIDESRGLEIEVNGVTLTVRSNPANPDSDGDGLPDFVEYQVGSNPENIDTDGDGLTDYDEFSGAQFDQFSTYADRFESFSLDSAGSRLYGTRLNNVDSDIDGLTDFEEVTGFSLPTLQNGVVANLFVETNPLVADSDFDGLPDRVEVETDRSDAALPSPCDPNTSPCLMTNPLVSDTDGDGADDGKEIDNGQVSPLVPDRLVRVYFYQLSLFNADENEVGSGDWDFAFYLRKPGRTAPGTAIMTDWRYSIDCTVTNVTGCENVESIPYTGNDESPIGRDPAFDEVANESTHDDDNGSYINTPVEAWVARFEVENGFTDNSETFVVREGDNFSVNGSLVQFDGGSGNFSCIRNFSKSFDYRSVVAQPFQDLEDNLSEDTCRVTLRYVVEAVQ